MRVTGQADGSPVTSSHEGIVTRVVPGIDGRLRVTEGVPVAVEEAQTVRLPREPIGAAGLGEVLAERGREWAGRKAVA